MRGSGARAASRSLALLEVYADYVLEKPMHKLQNTQDRPVEVTPAMIEAGVEALEDGGPLTYSGLARAVYLAMARAASPGNAPVAPAIAPGLDSGSEV